MTTFNNYLEDGLQLIKQTIACDLDSSINQAIDALFSALQHRRPVLVCGNGGSASDAMHIAGELVGKFLHERTAQNVIALSANQAVITAWANDYSFETVFSRQVEAYGCEGGVLWAISTSGNSKNVVAALKAAKSLSMTTLGLTGEGGGAMKDFSDILVAVPSRETPRIQELHIAVYHYICAAVEEKIVGSKKG